jgi:hypothetical protein
MCSESGVIFNTKLQGNRQVSKNQKQKRDAPKSYTRDTLSSLLKRNKYNEF